MFNTPQERKDYITKIYGKEPETMDELAECVRKVVNAEIPVSGFAWKLIHTDNIQDYRKPIFFDRKSNSYKEPKFDGWNGRVWVKYGRNPVSFGSNHFDNTLVHIQCGGAGTYDGPFTDTDLHPCYSWTTILFDDDWPLLQTRYKEEKIFNKLKGICGVSIHGYEWS